VHSFARIPAALAAGWFALTAMTSPTLESEVLARINHARQHPQDYARELREYRSHIRGGILYLPGDANGIITREGRASVDEAIDFLEAMAPLPPLSMAEVLAMAARDHADEQGYSGGFGHVSDDGASPGERVRRRGGDIYVGESISYGFDDPDAVVRQLVIDDGVPDRGHRKLLFARDFRYAGVGCAAHRRTRYLCVIDLSGTADGTAPLPAIASTRGAQVFRFGERRAAEVR